MTVDLRTLILIRRRVEAAPILLYHDTRTPVRRAARIARVRAWMGIGWDVTGGYRRELPRAGRDRTWKRSGAR